MTQKRSIALGKYTGRNTRKAPINNSRNPMILQTRTI
ncbi:LOW QUALITY PROTEIN: hypothetical protein TorRG33x02_180660 [Trema orientale]|uniref:Uncharacterized protein n=1 Tax=Trema orientale TaxID=63057 RepID=A0A2P5EL05_TREOI|nr:LOW QUALITY PROTEIN: hypothetical protein TorRG33x02_180660 [Trema orientale]